LVADEIFEKELRPTARETRRPVGDRLAADCAEQAAPPERERGQYASFDLGRQGQDALFRLAVVERIVDLHEIRPLASERRLDRGEIGVVGRGDSDIAAEALRLPRLELREGLLGIAHVVEL